MRRLPAATPPASSTLRHRRASRRAWTYRSTIYNARASRRGGRVVECGGLENRYWALVQSRVRIPPPPLPEPETASLQGKCLPSTTSRPSVRVHGCRHALHVGGATDKAAVRWFAKYAADDRYLLLRDVRELVDLLEASAGTTRSPSCGSSGGYALAAMTRRPTGRVGRGLAHAGFRHTAMIAATSWATSATATSHSMAGA
jgi:hypothetical protein